MKLIVCLIKYNAPYVENFDKDKFKCLIDNKSVKMGHIYYDIMKYQNQNSLLAKELFL
jgi:hypothetical protein